MGQCSTFNHIKLTGGFTVLKNKALLGIVLAIALVVAQVVAAEAASNGQTVTPPTDTPTPGVTPSPTAVDCSGGSSTSGTPTAGGTSTSTNPVGEALCNYFQIDVSSLALQGFGYGEIAQACWMSKMLVGDASLCQTILQDKMSGDYSGLTLPGGVTVSNWGQLKQAVFVHEGKMNLGQIVSGHAGGFSGGKPSWAGGGNGHGHGNNP